MEGKGEVWTFDGCFSGDLMLAYEGGDPFRLFRHPMWLGQATSTNLLNAASVTLCLHVVVGGPAGGMLAQRACCEERHL